MPVHLAQCHAGEISLVLPPSSAAPSPAFYLSRTPTLLSASPSPPTSPPTRSLARTSFHGVPCVCAQASAGILSAQGRHGYRYTILIKRGPHSPPSLPSPTSSPPLTPPCNPPSRCCRCCCLGYPPQMSQLDKSPEMRWVCGGHRVPG